MNISFFLPGAICIIAALIIMFRLMHYAQFYAPSYFFWIGAILTLTGIVSLIEPLSFLFIFNRIIAACVLCGGVLTSITALLWPVKVYHSETNLAIDNLQPDYSFNEYHEVTIDASIENAKLALKTTGVKDIPAVLFLMKIRGIAKEKDMSDKVTRNEEKTDSFSTPDFNFMVASPSELLTVMILKASAKTAPPEITTAEEFMAFNEPGYVKVAINFRFIKLDNGKTLLSTETRNRPMTKKDRRIFGRYWRVVYPGSAIIRRVWLDTLAQKAKNSIL